MRAWAGALACALACAWLLTLPSGAARSAEAAAAPDPHESRNSPVGLWQTISDSDGKPRGLVQIRDHDGVLSGRIVGTLRADESPDARCERCPGERKGQKLLGMTILSGLRRQGDGAQARWTGGEILDPDNGRSYDVTLTLEDGGQTLKVRGYIGVSLLGRTQRWRRAPAGSAGIDPGAGSRP